DALVEEPVDGGVEVRGGAPVGGAELLAMVERAAGEAGEGGVVLPAAAVEVEAPAVRLADLRGPAGSLVAEDAVGHGAAPLAHRVGDDPVVGRDADAGELLARRGLEALGDAGGHGVGGDLLHPLVEGADGAGGGRAGGGEG